MLKVCQQKFPTRFYQTLPVKISVNINSLHLLSVWLNLSTFFPLIPEGAFTLTWPKACSISFGPFLFISSLVWQLLCQLVCSSSSARFTSLFSFFNNALKMVLLLLFLLNINIGPLGTPSEASARTSLTQTWDNVDWHATNAWLPWPCYLCIYSVITMEQFNQRFSPQIWAQQKVGDFFFSSLL